MDLFKNKVLKNASWLIAGKIAQMALSLVVGVISARFLGPSNYGLISYGNAIVAFFMSFCTLGINSVIIKEFSDHPDDEGLLLGSSIFLRVLSSFGSIVLIFFASLLLDYGKWETIIVVLLSSVSLLFHAFDTINYWFQYKYQSKIVSITTFFAYLATSMYKMALLLLGKSVMWFAFATSVDYIALALLLLWAYKRNGGPKLSISFKRGVSVLKKSYHYIISGMLVSIYGQTDKLMLKQMLGEETVGYYTTAMTICGMWTFVLTSIIDAANPIIISSYNKSKENFELFNKRLYAAIFYLSTFASIVLTLCGKYVVKLLYGEAYLPAVIPLQIITWYVAFSYFGVARGPWIVCHNYQKYLKYMYVGAALTNVVLNFVLIPVLGVSGAALASLITQIFTSLILPSFIRDLRPNAKLILEAIFLRKMHLFNRKTKQ